MTSCSTRAAARRVTAALAAAPRTGGNVTRKVVPRPGCDCTSTRRVVVGDDAMDDRQTEPGALAEGAAERLEDAVDFVGRNADAIVGDGQHAATGRRRRLRGAALRRQRPAVGHRAQPIGGEVPDDLPHLVLVGLDEHVVVRQVDVDRVRSPTSVLLRSSVAVS